MNTTKTTRDVDIKTALAAYRDTTSPSRWDMPALNDLSGRALARIEELEQGNAELMREALEVLQKLDSAITRVIFGDCLAPAKGSLGHRMRDVIERLTEATGGEKVTPTDK